VQPRNARCVLQDAAALLRLGGNQFRHLTLPHEGRGVRSGSGIGEEQLYVACTHFAPVQLVGGTGFPLDASGDLQGFRPLAPLSPALPLGDERHLGHVAARAVGGTGEDDVVHPAAAHRLVGTLTHDEAERFDEVGLAAAVRTDDAGEAGLEGDVDRVDERLEAVKAEPRHLHGHDSAGPAVRRLAKPLEQRLDGLVQLGNGQRALVFLPVYKESRRRLHAK
jgi:hypothetical protein